MVLEKSGHYSTKEQVDELLTDNNPNFEKIDILLNSLLTYEASWLIQDKDNLSLITQLLEKLLDCDFQKWTIKDGVDIEKYKKFTDDIVDLCLNFDYDKKEEWLKNLQNLLKKTFPKSATANNLVLISSKLPLENMAKGNVTQTWHTQLTALTKKVFPTLPAEKQVIYYSKLAQIYMRQQDDETALWYATAAWRMLKNQPEEPLYHEIKTLISDLENILFDNAIWPLLDQRHGFLKAYYKIQLQSQYKRLLQTSGKKPKDFNGFVTDIESKNQQLKTNIAEHIKMLKARSQYLTVTAFSRLYQHQISPLTALFPEFEFYANISQRQYFNGQFIDPAKTEMLWFKQSQELEMIRQAFQLQQNSIRPQDFQSAILNFLTNSLRALAIRLGEAPCDWCVGVCGSYALGYMTPYSDLDIFILVKDSKYIVNAYFQSLITILRRHLITLSEPWQWNSHSPQSLGLHLDEGDFLRITHTIKYETSNDNNNKAVLPKLLQTPEGLAQWVIEKCQQEEDAEFVVGYSLLTTVPLAIDDKSATLFEEYQTRLNEKLVPQVRQLIACNFINRYQKQLNTKDFKAKSILHGLVLWSVAKALYTTESVFNSNSIIKPYSYHHDNNASDTNLFNQCLTTLIQQIQQQRFTYELENGKKTTNQLIDFKNSSGYLNPEFISILLSLLYDPRYLILKNNVYVQALCHALWLEQQKVLPTYQLFTKAISQANIHAITVSWQAVAEWAQNLLDQEHQSLKTQWHNISTNSNNTNSNTELLDLHHRIKALPLYLCIVTQITQQQLPDTTEFIDVFLKNQAALEKNQSIFNFFQDASQTLTSININDNNAEQNACMNVFWRILLLEQEHLTTADRLATQAFNQLTLPANYIITITRSWKTLEAWLRQLLQQHLAKCNGVAKTKLLDHKNYQISDNNNTGQSWWRIETSWFYLALLWQIKQQELPTQVNIIDLITKQKNLIWGKKAIIALLKLIHDTFHSNKDNESPIMKLGSLTIHILHYGIFLPLQQALEKSSPNYQFLLQNLLKSFLDMRYDQFSRFDEDSHSMVINHLFYTTLIEYPSSCGWSPLYEREQRRWMNSVKSLSTDEPTSCIVEGIPETKQRQYLPMTLIDILFKDHELQINPQQKSTESTIIQFQWKQQTFFLKTFPTDTLDGLDQQLAIEYLHRLLGGSSHVALTWPLKLIYQQDEQRKTYYCTVSQEVIGDDLEKIVAETPTWLDEIDPINYGQVWLLTYLTSPKKCNLQHIKGERLFGNQKTLLKLINNRYSFAPPFQSVTTNGWIYSESRDLVTVKTPLYLLPQHQDNWDENVLTWLQIIHPDKLFRFWQHHLEKFNRLFKISLEKQSNKQQTHANWMKSWIFYSYNRTQPQPQIETHDLVDTSKQIYYSMKEKLILLHRWLGQQKTPPSYALTLSQFENFLAEFYSHLKNEIKTYNELQNCLNDKTDTSLIEENLSPKHLDKSLKLPLSYVQAIDFRRMRRENRTDKKEQFFMFNLLNIIIENTKQHNIDKHKDVNYHTLFELDLSGCEVINESMLIDLLEKLPKLRVLTLKECPQFNILTIVQILSHRLNQSRYSSYFDVLCPELETIIMTINKRTVKLELPANTEQRRSLSYLTETYLANLRKAIHFFEARLKIIDQSSEIFPKYYEEIITSFGQIDNLSFSFIKTSFKERVLNELIMVGTPFPDDLTTHAHFDPTDKLVFDDATTSFKEDDSKKLEAATNLNSEDLMTTFYQVNNPFVNLNKTSREDASSSSDTENSIESDKRISSVELLNNFAIDPKKTSFQKIKSENKKAAENPASLGRMAAIRAFPHMTPMKKSYFLAILSNLLFSNQATYPMVADAIKKAFPELPIKHAINFLDALDSDHPDDSMHIIKGIGLLAASFPKKIHIDVLKKLSNIFRNNKFSIAIRVAAIDSASQFDCYTHAVIDDLEKIVANDKSNHELRLAGIRALGNFRLTYGTLETFFNLLEKNIHVSEVENSLRKISITSPEIIEFLRKKFFGSKNKDVRKNALITLGQLRPVRKEIITTLMDAMGPAQNMEKTAIAVLKKLPCNNPQSIEILLKVLHNKLYNDNICLLMINKISEANPMTEDVVHTMLEQINQSNIAFSVAAIRAIKTMHMKIPERLHTKVIHFLIEKMTKTDNSSIILAIIEVLAVFSPFSPDKAIEIIRILFNLNKNDPMIRATVITAIANLLKWAANNDISETVEKLFKFFDDPANNVRTATIMALGNPRWSNDIYYKNLLKVLHNKEEHLEVKEAAIRKLSELKRHFKTHVMMEVVKATLAIAKDENHLLSHLCIWLLGELGKETVDVINVLLKMLTSYELKTKITAAKALGKLGVANATIIDALIIALQDKESSMIKATNEALIQLFLISPELVTQKLIYHLENKINSANEAAILILLGKLFSTETCQIYLEKTLPPRMQPKTVIELPYPIINHVLSLVDDKSLDETRDINREWYRIYRNHKSNYRRHFFWQTTVNDNSEENYDTNNNNAKVIY